MKDSINLLREIYRDKDINLEENWDELENLAKENLVHIEVISTDKPKSNPANNSGWPIENRKADKESHDQIHAKRLKKDGISLLADEKRHQDNNRLQNALIVITVIYALSATLQTMTISAANYGENILGLGPAEWHSTVMLSSLIVLFGVIGFSIFRGEF